MIFLMVTEYLRHGTMFFSCVDNPKVRSKSEAKRAHLTGLSCDQNFVPIFNKVRPIVWFQENIDGNYCETWEPRVSQSWGLSKVFSDQK